MTKLVIDWFRLDPRSLALFRILLGLTVAADLTQRALAWPSLYSDSGVLPSAEWLRFGVEPWPPAWLVDGLGLFSPILPWAGVGAGIVLSLGLYPRQAALVAWVVLALVHARNPFVNYGADVLLRMLLLWSCWLQLDCAWSWGAKAHNRKWGIVGELGLQFQVVTVFVIAGLAKLVDPVWEVGEGVARALDHELLSTQFGQALFEHPTLTWAATHLTSFLEIAGPLLLYVPLGRDWLRLLTILAMGGMCLGFNLGLHVGLFPWAGFIGLSAFVPGMLWDRIGLHLAAGEVRVAGPSVRKLAGAVGLVLIGYTLVWNVGLWRSAEYSAPWPLGTIGHWLRLEQKWGMFTRLPSTGWIRVSGSLADGSEVDLLAAGGPLPEFADARSGAASMNEAPVSMATRVDGIRWRVFFLGMTESFVEQERRAAIYLRYLCRQWNVRAVDGDTLLRRVSILYESRALRTNPSASKRYTTVNLGSLECARDQ